MQVYLSEHIAPSAYARLARHFEIVDNFDHPEQLAAMIIRRAVVPRTVIARAPNLKVIAMHGVSRDTIDTAAAAEYGVPVPNVPGLGAPAVAELAVAELLAAGADVVTLGNHTFGKPQIAPFLDENRYILRPANFTGRAAGRGCAVYDCGAFSVAVLVLIGVLTVLHAGVNAVAKLFDDTAQKQEYEDKLEGLVLFDPVPFEGIENIDDLTLREAAVWGCVYSIQETQGGFDGYNTDPDTEQLLIPSVDVDAYLAKLVGPSFRMTHKTFEMEDMTIEFDDTTQCYKIPVTGSVGSYRATVTKLFKKDGLLHVTVGYIPNQNATDSILTTTSDTPVKYMDYLFSRQSGSWYLTGLTESETKPESTAASTASEPAMMADSEVQDAILATGGETPADSDAASSEAAAASEEADSTAESEAASDAEPQAESAASAAA